MASRETAKDHGCGAEPLMEASWAEKEAEVKLDDRSADGGAPSPTSALRYQADELEKLRQQLQATLEVDRRLEEAKDVMKAGAAPGLSSLSTCATIGPPPSTSETERGQMCRAKGGISGPSGKQLGKTKISAVHREPKDQKHSEHPKGTKSRREDPPPKDSARKEESAKPKDAKDFKDLKASPPAAAQSRRPQAKETRGSRGPPASARAHSETVLATLPPARDSRSMSPPRLRPAAAERGLRPVPAQKGLQPGSWLPSRRQVGAPIDMPRKSVRNRLQRSAAWRPGGKDGRRQHQVHDDVVMCTDTSRCKVVPSCCGALAQEASDVSLETACNDSFHPMVQASSTTSTTSLVSPSPKYSPQMPTRRVSRPGPCVAALVPSNLLRPPTASVSWRPEARTSGPTLIKASSMTALHSKPGPPKKEVVRL